MKVVRDKAGLGYSYSKTVGRGLCYFVKVFLCDCDGSEQKRRG